MQLDNKKKIAVLKRIFNEDIELFGRFFFSHHLKIESPPFHREIFKLFQSNIEKLAVGAPRGHAKSTITDLVYLAWEIVRKEKRFVLVVSDTYSQSVLFLEALKAEFEANEKLKSFYGDMMTDKWKEGEIIIGDTMIRAIGAGMKVRGLKYKESRPDLIIVDDLENDESVESLERREKLERWFNGALIPSLAKGGRVVIIGTILHFDSLLAKILSDTLYTEYIKRRYSAITESGALWPEHLSLEELETIKRDYISKGLSDQFYKEYMNTPISMEDQHFKQEEFVYYSEQELLQKEIRTFITIDRAYSTIKIADSTGIIVNSVDRDNKWHIRMAERFKGDDKELIEKLFNLHRYWKPDILAIEQKAFEYTLKPHLEDEMRRQNYFFSVTILKDGGRNKNLRIEGLVPRFRSKSIFMKQDQADLIDELIQFPRSKHDDLSDALAYQLETAEKAEDQNQDFNLYGQSFN